MHTKFLLSAAAILLMANLAHAANITSPSDPALAGGAVIDFESQTLGSYTHLQIGNVLFGGSDGPVVVENTYAGQYDSRGSQYLQNNSGSTTIMTFQFSKATSAFGFNLGATDYNAVLNAYNAANVLLGTYTVAPVYSSNAGDFAGISANGIDHATLTLTAGDYILLDNFTYAVPEPTTWALMLGGAGFLGFGGWRRSRAASQA